MCITSVFPTVEPVYPQTELLWLTSTGTVNEIERSEIKLVQKEMSSSATAAEFQSVEAAEAKDPKSINSCSKSQRKKIK